MFDDLFLSEPFYLSHTEGSYTDWGRGVTQERDFINLLTVGFLPTNHTIVCDCLHAKSMLNSYDSHIQKIQIV